MAKLTAAKRNALPSKSFVFPQSRKFPINDPSHARNALSRAAAKGGAVEAKVRAAVHRKYPSIGKGTRGEGARTNAMTRTGPREHGTWDWSFGAGGAAPTHMERTSLKKTPAYGRHTHMESEVPE